MIRIERVRLPPGMTAFARRENGTVFVYVSAGLPPGARLAAIREALRAAPDAGWRSGRHPVLLPALAGGAGLRRAPEGRWPYWALLTAAVAVAASLIAMTVLYGSGARHAAAGPPGSAPPGGQSSPGPGRAGGPTSSPGSNASLPGGGPAELKPSPRGPKPQTSGTPVPVPTPGTSPTTGTSPAPTPGTSPTTPAPQPSPTSGAPTPGSSPSPSPSKSPPGGSPAVCVVVLGVTICLG
jgi:hypothetical protein